MKYYSECERCYQNIVNAFTTTEMKDAWDTAMRWCLWAGKYEEVKNYAAPFVHQYIWERLLLHKEMIEKEGNGVYKTCLINALSLMESTWSKCFESRNFILEKQMNFECQSQNVLHFSIEKQDRDAIAVLFSSKRSLEILVNEEKYPVLLEIDDKSCQYPLTAIIMLEMNRECIFRAYEMSPVHALSEAIEFLEGSNIPEKDELLDSLKTRKGATWPARRCP